MHRLIGLALSPPQFHRVVWNECLNTPPWTGDRIVDANLTVFRDYFLAQWLPDREKSLLWNHFDRDGPRTTNNAEAYHGGLRSAFASRKNAPLGIFLGKLKQLHHEIRCWVKLLQRGAAPNPRCPKYITNDRNIAVAKENLQWWLDTVQAEALTNPLPGVLLEEHEATTAANLLLRLLRHLDHVQHFIAL